MARLWRLTSSELKANITSTGKLSRSEAAVKAVYKLIAGLACVTRMAKEEKTFEGMEDWEIKKAIAVYTGEKFSGNLHTDRGHDLEADAVAKLSERIGLQLTDVGMCVMGDTPLGVVSCSPDAIAYRTKKIVEIGAEIKCPTYAKFIELVDNDVLPKDYALQVHSSMAICETERWHFAAYFPGHGLFHKEVRRDHFTDTIAASLEEFRGMYADQLDSVQSSLAKIDKAESPAVAAIEQEDSLI
tara:strand:- start:8579 stop:9307 length:729 start_codon:yes stop_codon:yes gene_type:complete